MANLFEHTDRRVVPNWRSFGQTIVLGELNSYQVNKAYSNKETDIFEYIIDWKINKTVSHAADLLSAAFVNNKTEEIEVKNAASFILSNENNSSKSQTSLAKQILNRKNEKNFLTQFEEIEFDHLSSFINPELVRDKIRQTKYFLNSHPKNAVHYVELSRYYSILGQEINAIKAMKVALHLSPDNRFILRSATRLFIHYHNDKNNDYLDYIHDILRKSSMTRFDPWLISAEISVATIRNRNSKFIKKGLEIINSKNFSPFNFTELASGIGTIELLNGSQKKSRELFSKSLICPNDNSLAQIEWASTKDRQLTINASDFEVSMNFEALALDNFHNMDFKSSLDNAVKWFVDMPFSKRPIMFGSNLASTILKDQSKSISFLNAGLMAHPNDPQLLNNLAYALALDNRPLEALEEINKIKTNSSYPESTKICLMATKGLIYFRSGFYEPGRQMYLEAIEHTNIIKDQELNWKAILNYAREEILVNSDQIENIMGAVEKIPNRIDNLGDQILKDDVVKLYKMNKEKQKAKSH